VAVPLYQTVAYAFDSAQHGAEHVDDLKADLDQALAVA
jgi:O-acetylhomoserine/O-acetylserine sulfhydrylase-like pyridoxal-dependent enzyme